MQEDATEQTLLPDDDDDEADDSNVDRMGGRSNGDDPPYHWRMGH